MRPEAPRGIFGEILGTPPRNFGEPRKKRRPLVKSAAGFGPAIKFSHLSLAFSLILSGVSQNEVSFGKKQVRLLNTLTPGHNDDDDDDAGGGCRGCTGGSPQAGCELGGPSAGKSPPRRPEAPQGRSRGPPRKSRGAPKKTAPRTQNLQPDSGRKRRWPACHQQSL